MFPLTTLKTFMIVEQSVEVLDDIRVGAESIEDMRSELAREIFEAVVIVRFRIVEIIMAKSNVGIDTESIP